MHTKKREIEVYSPLIISAHFFVFDDDDDDSQKKSRGQKKIIISLFFLGKEIQLYVFRKP